MFDSKILPILLYGSEVWFSHTSPGIEKIHNFVRTELGRYKIDLFKKLRAVKYWFRIIALPENRYPTLCYKMQERWVANNTDCWHPHVRKLLFSSGFGEVWLNQGAGHVNSFMRIYKERLVDIDKQTLNLDI